MYYTVTTRGYILRYILVRARCAVSLTATIPRKRLVGIDGCRRIHANRQRLHLQVQRCCYKITTLRRAESIFVFTGYRICLAVEVPGELSCATANIYRGIQILLRRLLIQYEDVVNTVTTTLRLNDLAAVDTRLVVCQTCTRPGV